MPSRGSFRDRLAQEMCVRDRRKEIRTQLFQAQLVAAGMNIPGPLFNALATVYIDEVTHDNYRPAIAEQKRAMYGVFLKKRTDQVVHVKRADNYEVKSSKDFLPYSAEEKAEIQKKLRARALKAATRK